LDTIHAHEHAKCIAHIDTARGGRRVCLAPALSLKLSKYEKATRRWCGHRTQWRSIWSRVASNDWAISLDSSSITAKEQRHGQYMARGGSTMKETA
jgi:hypothetical protein